jgi:hypothetical protein
LFGLVVWRIKAAGLAQAHQSGQIDADGAVCLNEHHQDGAAGPAAHDGTGACWHRKLRTCRARAPALILGYCGMTAVRELLFTFVAAGRLRIVARVDIDDRLRGAQAKALARGIESGLKHEAEEIYRVDVVAISGAQAVNA